MYPFIRFALQTLQARKAGPLGLFDTHVSWHRCWPWDLDPWVELNNGRTLTLYDLGRIPMAQRVGLVEVLRKHRWGITVAGNSTRYRRRVRAFDRYELRSRCLGWDARFIYIEHSMWLGTECANHCLIRSAFTDSNGIVAPARVVQALDKAQDSPPLPDWVSAWIAADSLRPWPPERSA